MLRWTCLLICSLLALGIGRVSVAQTVAPETVLKNLHHPCGIAVRPGGTADRYEVFIAESGAGRVIRWATHAPDASVDVITGFPAEANFDRFEPRGPVALWFLDPGMLVVGMSGASNNDLVRSYELPDDDQILSADADNDSDSARERTNGATCLAITRSRANEFVTDALLLAVHSGNEGSLLKARVQAGIVGKPRPFDASESFALPTAVTTSPAGRIVVGDRTGGLTFYNPIDGKVELHFATELKQLTSLAYSPTSGSLYAADFVKGIHRIDDASEPGKPACNPVRIAEMTQASSLAFAPDGAMYLVTFGGGDNGTLQVITGDL